MARPSLPVRQVLLLCGALAASLAGCLPAAPVRAPTPTQVAVTAAPAAEATGSATGTAATSGQSRPPATPPSESPPTATAAPTASTPLPRLTADESVAVLGAFAETRFRAGETVEAVAAALVDAAPAGLAVRAAAVPAAGPHGVPVLALAFQPAVLSSFSLRQAWSGGTERRRAASYFLRETSGCL